MTSPKLKWSELMEDNSNNNLSFLLPPRQVIGPDAKGIKKTIEFKFDEHGNMVRVTTTSRVKKLANTRLTKRAVERRSWKKFGDAVGDNVGITIVSNEDILLEPPTLPGAVARVSYVDMLTEGGNRGGAVLKLCRRCGNKGDHWTAMCPYKDKLGGTYATFVKASGTHDSGSGAYSPP